MGMSTRIHWFLRFPLSAVSSSSCLFVTLSWDTRSFGPLGHRRPETVKWTNCTGATSGRYPGRPSVDTYVFHGILPGWLCVSFTVTIIQVDGGNVSSVINRRWMSLVITLGGCSRRTWWSSSLDWTTTYTTFTVAVLLLVHDHMFLQNVLQPCDLIMWLGFLSSPAIYISTPLYTLRFWTKCSNAWETFSCLGLP